MRIITVALLSAVVFGCTYNPAPKNILTMNKKELGNVPRADVCRVAQGGIGNKTITDFIEERRIDCAKAIADDDRRKQRKQKN